MNTFGWAIRLTTRLFEHFTSKEKKEERRKRDLEGKVDDMTDAVSAGDEDKLNARLRDHMMKLIVIGSITLLAYGCIRTSVRYIPAEQKAVKIEHNGVQGWFVPDPVMAILMEKAERYDAMQEKKLLEDN